MRLWLLAGFTTSAMAIAALAQSGEGPLQKLFGTSTAPKTKAPAEDPRRLAEIAVELAWLGDPVTFPYFLEARVEGAKLTVRGFVPDKAVREHALGLARLGLPCLLSNGCAFPWEIIRAAPLATGNVVEDMQLSLDLAVAGKAPRYCPGEIQDETA